MQCQSRLWYSLPFLSSLPSTFMVCERKLVSRDNFFLLQVEFMHIHFSYVFKSFVNCVRAYASSRNVIIEIHVKKRVCVTESRQKAHKERPSELKKSFRGVQKVVDIKILTNRLISLTLNEQKFRSFCLSFQCSFPMMQRAHAHAQCIHPNPLFIAKECMLEFNFGDTLISHQMLS